MRRVLHCPLTPWRSRPKCSHTPYFTRVLPRNSGRSVSSAAAATCSAQSQAPKENPTPFELYMRDLPETCIDWSSKEGRDLFKEAMCLGGLECYFPLAAQFSTQAEPAFCGLGTLAMVLNALNIDPGRVWKGPWRWYHEGMLDCCVPLPVVERRGISIDTFACLARCNGAAASVVRTETEGDAGLEAFREAVIKAASRPSGSFLIASYSRSSLGQTGDGHFSPIGGYHPEKDLVLVLDVARFKYPPHWVPLKMLYKAMQSVDPDTGRTRGYITVSRSAAVPLVLFVFGDRNQQGFWPQQSPRKSHVFPIPQQQKLFANEFHTAAGPFSTHVPGVSSPLEVHSPALATPLASVISETVEHLSPSAGSPLSALNTSDLHTPSDTPFGSPSARHKHTLSASTPSAAPPSMDTTPLDTAATCRLTLSSNGVARSDHSRPGTCAPSGCADCCAPHDPDRQPLDQQQHSTTSNCQGQGRSIAGAALQLRQASRVLDSVMLKWPENMDGMIPLSAPISALSESIAQSIESPSLATGQQKRTARSKIPPIQAALKYAIHALLCGGDLSAARFLHSDSNVAPPHDGFATGAGSSTLSVYGSPIAATTGSAPAHRSLELPSSLSSKASERVCSAHNCNLHAPDADDTLPLSSPLADSASASATSAASISAMWSPDSAVSANTTDTKSSKKPRHDLVSPKCFTRLSREQVAAVGALLRDLEMLPLYRAIKAELTEGETGVVNNCEHAATSCVKVSTAHMVSILLLTLYSSGDPFPPKSVSDPLPTAAPSKDGVAVGAMDVAAASHTSWETQMHKLLSGEFDNLDIDSVLTSPPLRQSSLFPASNLLSSIVLSSLDHSTPLIRSEVALLRSQMDLQLSVNDPTVC